ncbi:MAG: alpha/beta hydrolase [Alphaproteobacteria bacterium]|nr:alpha/beta hydrolase [Alphaproteobacteria bacterium]
MSSTLRTAVLAAWLGAAPAVAAPEPAVPAPLDARLTDVAYPYPTAVLPLTVQRQDLELVYMDVHPARPNGRTVVLLHGKNFSGAYWGPTVEALTGAGYRVVVPDQIGFGKSSKPAAFQYTFHALAEATLDLLDALEVDRFAVVGHSMGGMLATRLALLHPDRVEQLVLLNPIGLEDWQEKVPYVGVDAWYAAERAKTPEGIQAYMTASYFDGHWKPAYAPLTTMLAGWQVGPDVDRIAWTSALTYDMIFTQPVIHDVDRLAVPTLLLIGDRDRTALGKNLVPAEVAATMGDYPRLAREAAARIPGATLVLLPGLGHLPQVEAPAKTHKALIAFLDGGSAG